ncbi:MAG TPA: hypothetical protein VF102_09190, partial [Gemmatimonadaceae bacterium]
TRVHFPARRRVPKLLNACFQVMLCSHPFSLLSDHSDPDLVVPTRKQLRGTAHLMMRVRWKKVIS